MSLYYIQHYSGLSGYVDSAWVQFATPNAQIVRIDRQISVMHWNPRSSHASNWLACNGS